MARPITELSLGLEDAFSHKRAQVAHSGYVVDFSSGFGRDQEHHQHRATEAAVPVVFD
jgi:hypothetical protein